MPKGTAPMRPSTTAVAPLLGTSVQQVNDAPGLPAPPAPVIAVTVAPDAVNRQRSSVAPQAISGSLNPNGRQECIPTALPVGSGLASEPSEGGMHNICGNRVSKVDDNPRSKYWSNGPCETFSPPEASNNPTFQWMTVLPPMRTGVAL